MALEHADGKLRNPGFDDGKPLLEDLGNSAEKGSGISQSKLVAHRRRVAAVLQTLWDSGVVCICNDAICFSLAALFVKLIGSGVPVFQIVATRSFLSFVIVTAYGRATHITPLFGRRSNLYFLLARGLFGATSTTAYYFSLKMLPLADAVTLFFLYPAVTAVAAWALMKEPLGLRGVGGVVVSMCGLVLLTRPPFLFGESDSSASIHSGSGAANSTATASLHGDGSLAVSTAAAASGWAGQRLLGTLFGLLSAVLATGAFLFIRYIGKSESSLVVANYSHIFAVVTSLVPLAAGIPAPAVWPSGVQWALLLAITACSYWGQIFISRGFQLLNAAHASAINLTQVVYSYILGLLFLHESLTMLGGAGSVLIGSGAILVNWKPKKRPQQPCAPQQEEQPLTAKQPDAERVVEAKTDEVVDQGLEDVRCVGGGASNGVAGTEFLYLGAVVGSLVPEHAGDFVGIVVVTITPAASAMLRKDEAVGDSGSG